MATYTVAPRSNQAGFAVAVIGDDGARQTMLGFKTKADAEAWIDDDKKREPRQIHGGVSFGCRQIDSNRRTGVERARKLALVRKAGSR